MAQRKRIAMSKALFNVLVERSPSLEHPTKKRYIRRQSDEDADLMARAEVLEALRATRSLSCCLIEHDGSRYCIVSGIPEIFETPDFLTATDISPGLFQVAWIASRIPPIAKDLEIKEAIDYQFENDGFEGINLDEILTLFPKYFAFRFDSEIDGYSAARILAIFLVMNYEEYAVDFSEDLLSAFRNIFEEGDDTVPFGVLLQALLSFSWGDMYLHIYRCLENLFSSGPLSKLEEAITFSVPRFQLAKALEDNLSWRPNEQAALEHLLGELSDSELAKLGSSLSCSKGASVQEVAKAVYRLRNAQAHYRPALYDASYTNDEWQQINGEMLKVLNSIYLKHGPAFSA